LQPELQREHGQRKQNRRHGRLGPGSCGVGAQVILAVEPKFALDKEPLFWSAELG
jgi:hypothetical protein